MFEIDPVNGWIVIGFVFSILVLGIIALSTNNKPESTPKQPKHKHHKKRRRH